MDSRTRTRPTETPILATIATHIIHLSTPDVAALTAGCTWASTICTSTTRPRPTKARTLLKYRWQQVCAGRIMASHQCHRSAAAQAHGQAICHRALRLQSCLSEGNLEHQTQPLQSPHRVTHGLSLMDPSRRKGEGLIVTSPVFAASPEPTAWRRRRSEAASSPTSRICQVGKEGWMMVRTARRICEK